MTRELLIAILTLSLTQAGARDGWRRIEAPLTLAFPKDHGAHPDTRTEWWYLTGEAADASGREFGFQFTIFRKGMFLPKEGAASKLRPSQVLAGHLAIADLKGGRFVHAQKVRRIDGGLAFAKEDGLHVALENWEIRQGENGDLRITGRGDAAGPRMDLTFRPQKALVKQGEGGFSVKGNEPGNASAYVSWTRLSVSGELGLGGENFSVKGEGWFDHEWGSGQLGAGVVGWDWFGLRLDDGRELMVYGLRQADGSYTAASGGTLVAKDGPSRRLTRDDVKLEGTFEGSRSWRSAATQAAYPQRFRIRVPSESLDLTVEARLENCELDTRGTTGVVYWEGPVRVKGTASGATLGRGYMELTGYAASMAGKL